MTTYFSIEKTKNLVTQKNVKLLPQFSMRLTMIGRAKIVGPCESKKLEFWEREGTQRRRICL